MVLWPISARQRFLLLSNGCGHRGLAYGASFLVFFFPNANRGPYQLRRQGKATPSALREAGLSGVRKQTAAADKATQNTKGAGRRALRKCRERGTGPVKGAERIPKPKLLP